MPKTTWNGRLFGFGGEIDGVLSEHGIGIDDIREHVYQPKFDEWDCWSQMEASVGEDVLLQLVYTEPWFSYQREEMTGRPAIKQQMIDIIEAWQRANAIEWTEDDLQKLVEAMR